MASQTSSSNEDKIELRAVHDFDPRQMGYGDKMKFKDFLNSQRLLKEKESIRVQINLNSDETQIKKFIEFIKMAEKQRQVVDVPTIEKRPHRFENIQTREKYDILYDRELCYSEDNGNLREMDFPRQDNDVNPGNESMYSENKQYNVITEDSTSNNRIGEESNIMVDMETLEKKEYPITNPEDMQNANHFIGSSRSEPTNPYKCVLTFRRGDKMETAPSANIGDTAEWWSARNLSDGEIGFIPRTQVVIEKDQRALQTTLNDLPLELLDFVLEKACLFWILDVLKFQRDEDVIRALALVDFCWFQRITRRRFKTRIWLQLQEIFGKSRKNCAIIRNNQTYLMENIIPNDKLIASMLSLNCITEVQSHSIQRQRSIQDKNAELLKVVGSFDQKKFSDFIKCFRQTEQKTVAKIMENGGATIKVKVTKCGGTCSGYLDPKLLHQRFNDLRNRTKPWSHQADKFISHLRDEGIDILSSQLDRQTVVVWLWCFSQKGAENIRKLYKSNQLRDIFAGFSNNRPSIYESNKPNFISIDSYQLKKTLVMRPISIDLTERFAFGKNHKVLGVTKLRKEIYAVLESVSGSYSGYVIYVFEDGYPFNLRNKIRMREIVHFFDIASCEKENCLYVSDIRTDCVWKITIETSGRHKIFKWLATDYPPLTLSVSCSRLVVVNNASSKLMIYGSDAELLRSIQLPEDIVGPIHAVETSFGNFIIIHKCELNKEMEERKESVTRSPFVAVGPKALKLFVVSELTRDGQVVVRRFIPSNEEQYLNLPSYLSLDSNDQVFVAEADNMRVILLDSDLKWNKVLRPKIDESESMMRLPLRLCYDESKKQLIFGGDEIYVYNSSQN